jgi:hypothetical protein
MDSREWHFRLEGDEFDISGVTELFSDGVKLGKDVDGHPELIMVLQLSKDQFQAALDLATGLLAKLNGIAQVIYGNHENLRIIGVGCKDPAGGPMDLFIYATESIRSRARFGVGGSVTQSGVPALTPQKIGDQFLNAAYKNDLLERALYLLGSLPLDWRGLYMVLEAAEDAHGGERGLIKKHWVPRGQIKDFKATADSYKAIGLAARHGSTTKGIDKPRLTLEDARAMVRTILEKWCRDA